MQQSSENMDLADAIEQLHDQLAIAKGRVLKKPDIQFPIRSMTVELVVVAAKEADGKIGFKVPVINVEAGVGGRISREHTHRIVIEFDGPVDADGNPIRVARAADVPMD